MRFFLKILIFGNQTFLESAGISGSETIGKVIIAVDKLLKDQQPEAILVLGDTNSCMAAIPAKRQKIPIFHMEAGNRCFDMRVPEEINRRIVDHTADINLTYSSIAREYLLDEGIPADRVIKTGSPLFEVLNYYKSKIDSSSALSDLSLIKNEYFLVSAHREENIDSDKNFFKLIKLLNAVADKFNFPVIVSTHPRTRKRIDSSEVSLHENVQLLKPLSFTDYNHLQLNSMVVLSDSGTINEESSILNFPALNIREAHERPEAMEEAAVMMVGLDSVRVLQGLEIVKSQSRYNDRDFQLVDDYSKPNVSEKVMRIILSYTDYVKRVVWKEY